MSVWVSDKIEVHVLLSMTGFGAARADDGPLGVSAEVRAVNNRHFKLICRINTPYDALEPEVERLVRATVRRGTVHLALRVARPMQSEDYRLNVVALRSYRAQLQALRNAEEPCVELADLLALPGVVEDCATRETGPHDDWPTIERAICESLRRLQASRAQEGSAMATELLALGHTVARLLDQVAERAPAVVSGHEQRLLERVRALVRDRVSVEPSDLIREVAVLAERADVSEEITRLRAHIQQYDEIIKGSESAGRKLEFVVQEMGRETNTIGSKANDVTISRAVVEMKVALEKVRELIQNVE